MNPSELQRVVELVASSAKVLSKQSMGLLAEVEKYQLERDEARATLAELQKQIDWTEAQTKDELEAEIQSLKDQSKEDERELEVCGVRVDELLDLVCDLAELAHVVDPGEVEYRLLTADLGDIPARLRVGAQVRQAALPFGKAANG